NIDLPDIEEQNYRISVLDKCKLLIKHREDELKKLDDLIKARFVEMFDERRYKKVPLSELANNKVSTAKKDFAPDDIIKYIDISSIDNSNNQMTGYTEYVLKDAPSRAQQHIIKNDIVVSTVRPNLRNVALTPYEFENLVASSGFCILRAKENIRPEYIKAIVCSDDFTNKMTEVTTGANYPAIHDSDVMSYMAPNPPIEIQSEFADFVKQVDKSKSEVQRSLDETQKLFDSLMQEYFG
ncbi:MAG: restriction endonuclease subunit S, partial [Erysipelotrichaceae bacterium]|nr:restriction endonuclease subunit S [Erysipelotrichaceae bacterium]